MQLQSTANPCWSATENDGIERFNRGHALVSSFHPQLVGYKGYHDRDIRIFFRACRRLPNDAGKDDVQNLESKSRTFNMLECLADVILHLRNTSPVSQRKNDALNDRRTQRSGLLP